MNSTLTAPNETKVEWLQVVASKSGGDAHVVRCFDNVTTCDCKGWTYRNTCSHLAIGQAQQAREDAAWQALQEYEPTLADESFDEARALLEDNGPEPFDDEPAMQPVTREPQAFKQYDTVRARNPIKGTHIDGAIAFVNGDMAAVLYFNQRMNRSERLMFNIANLELITAERAA